MKHYKNMNGSVFLSDLSKIMILYRYNSKSAVDQCVGEWITWITSRNKLKKNLCLFSYGLKNESLKAGT